MALLPAAKEETMSTKPPLPTAKAIIEPWLDSYKHEHEDLLRDNSEFARWLEEEYVPLAGGWQY